MDFQYFLKGIANLSESRAQLMLREQGILCNWWYNVGQITPAQAQAKLTERNLLWHLSQYGDVDPLTGAAFKENTPFISTTAGTVERDAANSRNLPRPAILTALQFATRNFSSNGWVFYGYVYTLSRKTVELREFAEEVRDLHIYTDFLPFQPQGEIVAKIDIPSVRLEKAEWYVGHDCYIASTKGKLPRPATTLTNPNYLPPESFANIRHVI